MEEWRDSLSCAGAADLERQVSYHGSRASRYSMKWSSSLLIFSLRQMNFLVLFNGSHELIAISMLTHLALNKRANGLYPMCIHAHMD